MRALIFSDSHHDFSCLYDTIVKYPDIDLIIHAGDVQRDVDDIMAVFPKIPCAYVLGNNDYGVWGVPFERIFDFGGKKIFLTHGHNYSVKLTTGRVISKAGSVGADICIFGHTHKRFLDKGEILTVNPGAAYKSYGLLTVDGDNVSVELSDTL